MEDKDLKDYILVHKNEYEKLIKFKTKAIQYKKYILENTNNNQLVKAMVTIESKNLYKLIQENNEEEKNNE